MDTISEPVVILDEQDRVVDCNPAARTLFETSQSAIVGRSISALLSVDENRLEEWMAARGDDETYQSWEYSHDSPDGTRLYEVRQSSLEKPQSNAGAVLLFRDITEQNEVREQLRYQLDAITRLHRLATDITAAETKEAVYRRTVDGAVELFGCDDARMLTVRGDRLTVAARTFGDDYEWRPLSLASGIAMQSYQSETIHRIEDMTDVRSVSASMNTGTPSVAGAEGSSPVRATMFVPIPGYGVLQLSDTVPGAFDGHDEHLGELLASHVGTVLTRVDVEMTIRRERDRLDEFASVVSHDLRNPLSVAKGHVELATAEGEGSTHLDAIDRSLDRIERIVEDVLTLAREGDAVGEMETVSLEQVATRAWQNVATEDATICVETDDHIKADPARLEQVFENLYRNSVEHGSTDGTAQSNDGRSTVTVTVGGRLQGFYVADDGPGIPTDERKKVFDSGYSTESDGTGFGLTIVKRIIEAHGWDIAVTESQAGGAQFNVSGVEFVAVHEETAEV